jgi:hypothetical protein
MAGHLGADRGVQRGRGWWSEHPAMGQPVASHTSTESDCNPDYFSRTGTTTDCDADCFGSATAAAPAPVLSDDDHRLLHNLRSADGYEVDSPALVVEHAHRYCALVQQGFSGYQAWQAVVSESNNEVGMHDSIPRPLMGAARTPTEMAWNFLTAEALTIYPNCRD